MNIILGASGQVGSQIVDFLTAKNEPVKAVVRNSEKADSLRDKGAKVSIADYYDLSSLKNALKGGKKVFLITPENFQSDDMLGDTKSLLELYRKAITSSKIEKIVGLSSMGAQHKKDTGNLQMSYMLEHAFDDLPVQKIFIRPAYYYSNWLPSLPIVKTQEILPTFFPVNLEVSMIAPADVAAFSANTILKDDAKSKIVEITGPTAHSSQNVADILGNLLGKKIKAQQIPLQNWTETLQKFGFSEDAIENFTLMTNAVISGKTTEKADHTSAIEMEMTIEEFFSNHLNQ